MNRRSVVISKRFHEFGVEVSVLDDGLLVSADMRDFLLAVAQEALESIAAVAAHSAGNPALLMTNAQLVAKIKSSLSTDDVCAALNLAADTVIAELKRASVVAK